MGIFKSSCVIPMLALVCCSPAWAEEILELHTGVRQDALQWSIAGHPNGTNPNILSELTWKDVRSLNVGGEYHNGVRGPVGAGFRFNYGVIVDGRNQDSDYHGDNRTQEFNRSYSDSNDGHVLDLALSIGPNLKLKGPHDGVLVVRPVLGYSYHNQEYKMTNLVNVIPEHYTIPTPILRYHGLYNATWHGPFAGGELHTVLASGMRLKAAAGWHFGEYEGRANWVLRGDFQHPLSFRQTSSRVEGKTLSLTLESLPVQGLSYSGGLDVAHWTAGEGNDVVYLASGGEAATQFNGAKWTSYMLRVGVRRAF